MISVDEAERIVLRNVKTMSPRKVKLENALGYCLAENVKSDLDMPPFNRAAMDGYAVIAKDVANVPAELDVIENIRAGINPKKKVGRGQASKIMTGSVVPQGADVVIKVEETKSLDGDRRVRIFKETKKGNNIAKKAEDIRVGNVVLRKGTRIRPQEVGILAAVGVNMVNVFSAPSVGIISTGDELVKISSKPKPWQIRNSNSYSIAAQARQQLEDVEIFDTAKDDKAKIRSVVTKGLKKDVLILSGGVSMGEYDLVGEVLKEFGIKIFFETVALRPGKPTVFGKKGDKVIFGLPGNPVSTFVTFELFVRPCLRKMMGFPTYRNFILQAELETEIKIKKKRREFRPAFLRHTDGKWLVSPVKWHGSGDLFSTTNANCLLVVRETCEKLRIGDAVEVMLPDGPLL